MRQVYTRMKNLQANLELLLSNFMNGVKHLPATWTPERR